MSNEIATTEEGGLIPVEQSKFGDEKQFALIAGALYLPRVQLMGSNSGLCKKGKVKIGTFIVIQNKETIVAELGDQFSCMVLGWRPKAMRIGNESVKAFYDPAKQSFLNVEADAKKTNPKVMGAVFGPEFLVYMPEQKVFAGFFFNNPTMRRSAPFMRACLGKAATIRAELIEKSPYSWHGPVVTQCSTPLNIPDQGTPEREELNMLAEAERQKFNNPPEEQIEEVPTEAETKEERPR